MEKAIWRLILCGVTTTVSLTALGCPIADVMTVLGAFAMLLWLQEGVIESIRGRRSEGDRSKGDAAGRRRDTAA